MRSRKVGFTAVHVYGIDFDDIGGGTRMMFKTLSSATISFGLADETKANCFWQMRPEL